KSARASSGSATASAALVRAPKPASHTGGAGVMSALPNPAFMSSRLLRAYALRSRSSRDSDVASGRCGFVGGGDDGDGGASVLGRRRDPAGRSAGRSEDEVFVGARPVVRDRDLRVRTV